MADQWDMAERAMYVMDKLRQHYQADDELVISHLAIHVFNGFATAWKLMASGYYQAAALTLRDIIETTNLVMCRCARPRHGNKACRLSPELSAAYRAITARIPRALFTVEIRLLDHIVFGANGTVSLAMPGEVQPTMSSAIRFDARQIQHHDRNAPTSRSTAAGDQLVA
ncbi:JAB domain-containing protein [Lysobacter capsici]|uniref:JAB domain-containing protein n=1 Tax=Lysobacter capsici TaxID=435897 RepID=UPI001F201A28|nr:JAB domain-containing protein [Lysobacter capsici]